MYVKKPLNLKVISRDSRLGTDELQKVLLFIFYCTVLEYLLLLYKFYWKSNSLNIYIVTITPHQASLRKNRNIVSSCVHRATGPWVLYGGNLASTGPTFYQRERMFRLLSPSRLVTETISVLIHQLWKYLDFTVLTFTFFLSHCLTCHICAELFLHKQKLQFLQLDSSSPDEAQTKRILPPEELSQQLEKLLLEDMASDEHIFDWVEVR